MYVKFSEMELALAETENMQQTPNPAAQFPWAEPLLAEHSEDVRQVLRSAEVRLSIPRISYPLL